LAVVVLNQFLSIICSNFSQRFKLENFTKRFINAFYFKIKTQFLVYNNCAFDRFTNLLTDKTNESETDR